MLPAGRDTPPYRKTKAPSSLTPKSVAPDSGMTARFRVIVSLEVARHKPGAGFKDSTMGGGGSKDGGAMMGCGPPFFSNF